MSILYTKASMSPRVRSRKLMPLLILVLVLTSASASAGDHTRYVNPFIGTQTDATGALSGSTFPGACCPFGMVQLSPDTEPYVTWDPCSGYDYDRSRIYGFSHTHLSGTGCTDLFDVMLMPTAEECTLPYLTAGDYSQTFTHADEEARPGYYQVLLQPSGIEAAFTATPHAGIHRYTFPHAGSHTLIVDLDHSTYRGDDAYYAGKRSYQILDAQLRIVDDHTIEGFRYITGWAPLRRVFFHAEFSRPFVSHLLADGQRGVGAAALINGRYLRAALTFEGDAGDVITAKVALSAVDEAGARANYAAECASWDFDAYAQAADEAWEEHLARIDVEGTDEQKTIFYTALYHTFIQPNVISDVDGRYVGPDQQVATLPRGERYYSTFSLWDTFRAAHPLYNILEPELTGDFVRTMVRHHQAYGYLPIWTLWGQENYCMIGNHAVPVLSRAILTGIPGIDAEAAYRAMVESCTTPHRNSPFDQWKQLGYMPASLGNSVSITLEQSFDDACVAAAARYLGHDYDATRFTARSLGYRNLWDAELGFFVPKDEQGQRVEPFNPLAYDTPAFIEGNAWQYMWFVPHDPEGLIQLLGGRKAFLAKLDECFSLESDLRDSNGNASGFIGQYAHGNEPAHHTVYLYNFAGRPWRTQELVDQVRTSFYNATPCGYAGNDDCGQMSAWYIFSSLGFYPFHAGDGTFTIGTPLFSRAVIHLADGDFTIVAPRKSNKAIYVRSVQLDGQTLDGLTLTEQQIRAGGTLSFRMSTSHR